MHADFTCVPASIKVRNTSRYVLCFRKQTPAKRLLCVFFLCVAMPCQSVLEGLAQKNHVTQLLRTPDSVVQAVVRQGERLCAESDPRKGGYPAGY